MQSDAFSTILVYLDLFLSYLTPLQQTVAPMKVDFYKLKWPRFEKKIQDLFFDIQNRIFIHEEKSQVSKYTTETFEME